MQSIVDSNIYYQMRDSFCEESFPNEEWTPVIGFEELYEVSTLGRFRASCDIYVSKGSRWAKSGDLKYHKGQILKQYCREYMEIPLYDPGRSNANNLYYSHRMCLESFEQKTDDLFTDHIDGDKHNNQLSNLHKLTPSENLKKAYDNNENGMFVKRCTSVRRDDGKIYSTLKDAAHDNSTSSEAILSAISRNTKSGGHKWKFADASKQKKVDALLTQQQERRNLGQGKKITSKGYQVMCKETGVVMKASEFARQLGYKSSEPILNAIDYHEGFLQRNNLHFEIINR